MSDVLLVVVVITALAFDFTNGFHDTANAVAASISTRAMAPKVAVGFSAILNFVGAFISLKVATTIAGGIGSAQATTATVVFAALLGARQATFALSDGEPRGWWLCPRTLG